MKEISDKVLKYIYIIIIISLLLGLIIIINQIGPFINSITGKAVGTSEVCIGLIPSIETIISPQNAYVNNEYYYAVQASAGSVAISFSDDTNLFNISSTTGEIRFTPIVSDIGNYTVQITVTNSACPQLTSAITVIFSVFSQPPVLDAIGDLNATEDVLFEYDVNATDPDDDESSLVFSTNSTFFSIGASTGLINFTPTNDDVGVHRIEIKVTDPSGGSDEEVINFTVINVNDAPILDTIPNFTVANGTPLNEDEAFYYDVDATDIDGDPITYIDNTSLFSISPGTGEISFTPTADDIGNYSVEIYATDDMALDMQVVLFEVLYVNDPPVIQEIPGQTAVVNFSFYYRVIASDEETINITYHDNTTLFNINSGTGVLIFTPNMSDVGNHSINITVSDGELNSSTLMLLTVTPENRPPTIVDYQPNYTPVNIYLYQEINFNVSVIELDGHAYTEYWYLDGEFKASAEEYLFRANSTSLLGSHNITFITSDGQASDSIEWTLNVLEPPGPPPTGATGGAGGGAGGASCTELWICNDWSPCQLPGVRIRECIDQKECGTTYNKPLETEECTFSLVPTCNDGIKNYHDGQWEILTDCGGPCHACPTCDDGIQNQGETEVDCGGPCPQCAHVEVPKIVEKRPSVCGDNIADVKWELFTCPIDTWMIWLFIIIALIIINRTIHHISKKHKMLTSQQKFEKETVERIYKLISIAKESAKQNNISRLRTSCSRIEVLYNQLPESNKNKRKIYRKLSKLSKELTKLAK